MKRPIIMMLTVLIIALVMTEVIDSFNNNNEFITDANNDSGSSITTFYKWKDENGTWHYSDKPSVKNDDVETIDVNLNTNLIKGLRPVQKERVTVSENVVSTPKESSIPLPITVPLEKVQKIIKDARGVQDLINNREEEIKRASGQ